MSFDSFHGNGETVGRLRAMIAAGRLPHALILSGPQGAGKYTLALMLAKAMNCEAIEIVAQTARRTAAQKEALAAAPPAGAVAVRAECTLAAKVGPKSGSKSARELKGESAGKTGAKAGRDSGSEPESMSLFAAFEPEPEFVPSAVEEEEETGAAAELAAEAIQNQGLSKSEDAQVIDGVVGADYAEINPALAAFVDRLSAGGLPDFCGVCPSCQRIGTADDFEAGFEAAVEAREGLKETEKKETRILLQPHPNVMIVPPDPPQLLIKVDQVRKVIDSVRYRPLRGRRVYVFTGSGFIKEAANSLLKVLEEPPEYATLILLTENAGELLPTIRSRCVSLALAPLSIKDLEADLVQSRPELTGVQRSLVARLARGALGRARRFDIAAYSAARAQALVILRSATSDEHSDLFRATETFRAGAEGRTKTDQLISALYSLLEDLLFLQHGSSQLVRNTDILGELKRLSAATDFRWLERASEGLAEVQRGMRRNLLRSLSLDAFATLLESA